MNQGLRQTSPAGENKIVRAVGKASLWLAVIGLAALLLKVWGYHQILSFVPSPLRPEDSKIIKTAFYSEWITSGILLVTQAYVGWRLLRSGARGISASIWI